ncbi:MAG: iron-sulfur cluster assembly accessory protein [Deltaproteobacteria bacterium]|nr:iron-sulfur cluster assembly accessory protein [Deltaproteobacteria bacterium]
MAITLSESAHARLTELFAKQPDARGLRVGIRGGGCSGFSYVFEFESKEATEKDKVLTFGDFLLYQRTRFHRRAHG